MCSSSLFEFFVPLLPPRSCAHDVTISWYRYIDLPGHPLKVADKISSILVMPDTDAPSCPLSSQSFNETTKRFTEYLDNAHGTLGSSAVPALLDVGWNIFIYYFTF